MTLEERNERFKVFFQECQLILEKKGKDYEPSGIAYQSIKEESSDLGMTSLQMFGVYMSKQWSAVKSFIKNGKLQSEPIRARLHDLANFCALIAVILEEEK